MRYEVKKCAVGLAYRTWFNGSPRQKELEKWKEFPRRIDGRLRALGTGETSGLPTSRNQWHQWEIASPCVTVSMSHAVALAIKAVSGCDVTSDHLLRGSHDFTEFVKVPSAPVMGPHGNASEKEHETRTVSIDRIAFRRSRTMDVLKCHTKGVLSSEVERVGSVRFGLTGAQIALASEGGVKPNVTHLTPGTGGGTRAEGTTLVDVPDSPGKWEAHADGEIMEGNLFLANVAVARLKPGSELSLVVSTQEEQVAAKFSDMNEEFDKSRAKSNARNCIMSKVMKLEATNADQQILLSEVNVRLDL